MEIDGICLPTINDEWPTNASDFDPLDNRVMGVVLDACRKFQLKTQRLEELEDLPQILSVCCNISGEHFEYVV